MRLKQSKALLAVVAVVLVVSTVLIVVFLLQKQRLHKQLELASPTVSIGSELVSSDYNINEFLTEDGRLVYEIRGTLTEPLYFEGDILAGNFIIGGDKENFPVKVIVGFRGQPISTGIESETGIEFKRRTTEEILDLSQENKNFFLRITVKPDITSENPDFEYYQQQLETYNLIRIIVQSESITSNIAEGGLVFTPITVGFLL